MQIKQKKNKIIIISAIAFAAVISCVLVLTQCTDIFTKTPVDTSHYINLDDGLKITLVGSYNGIYMEDGSGDKVDDVLSIVVLNTNEKDLQYAEIYLKYEDYTAEFTVTNLPTGQSALLLEKKRAISREEKPDAYLLENEVFFKTPMDNMEKVIQVSGVNGVANIKNISDDDIVGDVVIYFKNYAQDMFYGGITYRITIKDGLKAGELKQTNAGHFSPSESKIVSVNIVK